MALQLQGIKCLYQVHPVDLDHRLLHWRYPLALSDVRGVLMITDLVVLPLIKDLFSSLFLVIIQEVYLEGILNFDVCLLRLQDLLLFGLIINRGNSLFWNFLLVAKDGDLDLLMLRDTLLMLYGNTLARGGSVIGT